MTSPCEAGEVFALLEGGGGGGEGGVGALQPLYAQAREPWVSRALLQYHARTGSARALDLLARAPEPHARHLLDALLEQLRGERGARRHALAALAPLVARRPGWLHRLPAHPLARELLRAARLERDALPLLHALLALAQLLPAAPALAAQHAPDLADALLRADGASPHLRLAQLALFHAAYATHPCTLLEALRDAGAAERPALAALLRSVRLHPGLVTGSRAREADAARWARLEPHDVLAECRRLSLHEGALERAVPCASPAPASAPSSTSTSASASASPAPEAACPAGSGAHAARAAAALRPGAEPWFPLGDRCGADSAPHTPLPAEPDAAEPPEAAVEATPENTPARDTRQRFRYPEAGAAGAARAIGRKEPSPAGDAYAARLARVALERRAADSPAPLGAADADERADREVLELTRAADADERAWPDADAAAPPALADPRRRAPPAPPAPPAPRRRAARAPRRAASCDARLPPARRASVAVQTVDVWPAPYEFLIADFYRSLPDDSQKQVFGEESETPNQPSEKLDAYLSELYAGRGGGGGGGGGGELAEQLAFVHAQLMYERWRREAHAERNRRLLGRCRQVRALELQNAALRERARAATRERDELRARLAAAPPPRDAAGERELRLEAALADERAARLRAEAALRDADAQRAADAAELQRARAESYEAARHVEALARAALAAERRAEHVRRLRRELLLLGEREARMADAARAAAAAPPPARDDRPLRAAAARAEADAEAAAARADAAAARAHELEAALAARDAALAELKRAARLAADEDEARLRALQDKYAALMRVLRANEARRLDLLAAAERRPAARE